MELQKFLKWALIESTAQPPVLKDSGLTLVIISNEVSKFCIKPPPSFNYLIILLTFLLSLSIMCDYVIYIIVYAIELFL